MRQFHRAAILVIAASLAFTNLLAENSAWAQVQMSTLTVPTPIPNPLNGFTVDYTMFGSKVGIGAASAQVKFYISASPDGSTGVALLNSFQIQLFGTGLGPYTPPQGTQSRFISRFSMPANTVALLESITAACQPQTWFILGQVDSTTVRSRPSLLGTSKQPDFFFTGGTISPSVIQPGGTTNISFSLFTQCPANTLSRVGVFLADANLQPLAFIGGVSIAAGAGTFTLPPTPITFSSSITPGSYYIVLLADVDGVIAESNENNNIGVFALEITASALAAASRDTGDLELDSELPDDVAAAFYDLELIASDDYIKDF